MTEAPSRTKKRPETSVESSKDGFQRMLASSSFILVIFVLGLPMWWKTTEVSRVPLPYDDINALTDVPIAVRSTVAVYAATAQRQATLVEELTALFGGEQGSAAVDQRLLQVRFVGVEVDAIVARSVKTAAELEAEVVRHHAIGVGDYLILEWSKLREDDVLVTGERTALIAPNVATKTIEQVLRTWIFEEHKLLSILASRPQSADFNHSTTTTTTTTPPPSTPRTRPYHAGRHLIPHPFYDVVISVLNPEPSQQHVHWDVRSAASAYLQPLFDALQPISRFNIKSQWLYQVALDHPRRRVDTADPAGSHHALDQRHLAHIVTALESKLGQPISDNPVLHLVVYVPPCSAAPLHIYDEQGRRVTGGSEAEGVEGGVDSFLSPKWGAIVVANPGRKVCADADGAEKIDVHISTPDVMQTLLYLVRRLVDVQNDVPIVGARREQLVAVRPRSFELDAFIRAGCVHLVQSTQLTLQSLVQLLDGIGNIVINEQVGRAVQDAYEQVATAKRLLAEGRLEEAAKWGRRAFDASERAFYDPSMLALLYFPDDQKFAIYIPLFLPILIPVAMSVLGLWRYWFRGAQEETD